VIRPGYPDVAPCSLKIRFNAAAFHSAQAIPFEHQPISLNIWSRNFHGSRRMLLHFGKDRVPVLHSDNSDKSDTHLNTGV
jgi:hypothetical protein